MPTSGLGSRDLVSGLNGGVTAMAAMGANPSYVPSNSLEMQVSFPSLLEWQRISYTLMSMITFLQAESIFCLISKMMRIEQFVGPFPSKLCNAERPFLPWWRHGGPWTQFPLRFIALHTSVSINHPEKLCCVF